MTTGKQFGRSLAHANEVQGILQGWTRPTVAMLAAECSAVIHRWIAQPLPKGPHGVTPDDLCDTNVAMLEAWETLTGTPQKDILTNYQPNLDIMNAAWELARLFNFRLRFKEGVNSQGDMVPAFSIDTPDMFVTQEAADALDKLNEGRDVL